MATKTRDRYTRSIRNLRAIYNRHGSVDFKHAVNIAWNRPDVNKNGSLFLFCSASGNRENNVCGCLTQIRRGSHEATDPFLTSNIQNDARLAVHVEDIKHPDELPVYAEWQRRMDRKWPGRNKE
jgi:hypothetical protein